MTKKRKLEKLTMNIAFQLSRLAIGWEDIKIIFENSDSKNKSRDFESVAETILNEGKVPDDINAFKNFAKTLDSKLDINLKLSAFDSIIESIWKKVKYIFSIVWLFIVSFIVLFGILGGHSSLMKDSNPFISFLILFVLIILLGAVEGLQVCVTLLRLKDLEDYRLEFPRTHSLHSMFKSEQGTNRFLGGRQLVVIVIVFFAAQLTSFPNMDTIPLTDIQWWGWFKTLFLDLGIMGAIFILWFGQLIPQFIANKHPQGFLNLLFIKWMFNISYFAESLEITRPGDLISNWISQWIPKINHIPISPKEKYNFEVGSVQGYGIIGLKKIWQVKQANSTLVYQNSLIFKKSGFNQIIDSSLLTPKTITRLQPSFRIVKNKSGSTNDENNPYFDTEVIHVSNNWNKISHIIRPKYGPFEIDDVVISNTVIEHNGQVGSDVIQVIKPINYILFRVKFIEKPREINLIKLKISKDDEALGGAILIEEIDIPLLHDRHGNYYIEYFSLYPIINTSYELSWNAIF